MEQSRWNVDKLAVLYILQKKLLRGFYRYQCPRGQSVRTSKASALQKRPHLKSVCVSHQRPRGKSIRTLKASAPQKRPHLKSVRTSKVSAGVGHSEDSRACLEATDYAAPPGGVILWSVCLLTSVL